MRIRHLRRATLILGAAVAALFLLIAGVTLRLFIGPVSLGPFAGAIEDSINQSISGLVIRFDQAVLGWSHSQGRVNLSILGTKVFDKSGRIIAQAPKAELDFDAASLLQGRAVLRRFALIGMQLTAVRTKEGVLKLGFRSTEGESDLLRAIATALETNAEAFSMIPAKDGNRLDRFAILDARLAFHDEQTGLFIISPGADLTVKSHDGVLDAALQAAVEISGVRATVAADAELLPNGMPRRGALQVRGLSLTALAANTPTFSALAPFGLTLDLTGNVELDAQGRVRSIDFGATGGGTAGRPNVDPVSVPIEKFHVLGRFDGTTKRLLLEDISFDGAAIKVKGNGRFDVGWQAGALTSLAGEVNMENGAINLRERFAAPVSFERLIVRGVYDRSGSKITLDNAVLSAGQLQANLAGVMDFEGEQSPAIEAKGALNPIAVRDLLRYWPVGLAEGARSWIDANIVQGRIGQAAFDAQIPAGALDQEALPEQALSLTFAFGNVTSHYIKGLTPLTGGQGQARLSGDTFRAEVSRAAVGPLAVSKGRVVIPDLHIPGAAGTIGGHVEGKVADVLALIDQEPLGYARRFHIDPASADGQVALDLSFTVPMLKDLVVEQVGIGIQAKASNVSLPIDPKRRLESGDLSFDIDGKALNAEGAVKVNGVSLDFKWTEDFVASGVTSHVQVQGLLDDDGRSKLGLPEEGLVLGPSRFSLALTGHRTQFDKGELSADLRDAEISVPSINLHKTPGQPATLAGVLHFGAGGQIAMENFALTGDAMEIRGGFSIDGKGGLLEAALPVVRVGEANDFAVTVKPMSGGGLAVRMDGKSFDASRVFSASTKPPAKAAKAALQVLGEEDPSMREPLQLDAKLERAVFRGGVTYTKLTASTAFAASEHFQNFALEATGPSKERVTGRFVRQADGTRVVTVEAGDAANLVRGLTGFASMRKGTLSANVVLPANPTAGTDPAADYHGTLLLREFTIVDQPFFTRLFSTGSLAGPLTLLQGRGIVFDKLQAPFTAKGKQVTINEGHGAGPAVGVSFSGVIDRRENTVNLAGTLVPLYGLNSMLGAVPILGTVLVSKQGEGVFGLTYRVSGNLEQPSLSVNPLSVLAPGIFRRIFEFSAPRAAARPKASPTGAAPAKAAPPTAAPAPPPVDVAPLSVPPAKPPNDSKSDAPPS